MAKSLSSELNSTKKEVTGDGQWSFVKSNNNPYCTGSCRMDDLKMKSIKQLKKECGINQNELLQALYECCSFYLSEDELQEFIEKQICCHCQKNNNL